MQDSKGVVVVGSGYWGKNLVRNFHQLGVLRVICDTNETTLAAFREQYPDVDTSLALSEALARTDVDKVVVATPAETHYPIAREALLAGKHVYVEKPLVLDETEARKLIDLAREQKRILMVGHLLQYHPVFVRLKEMVDAGELGKINYIYSNRLNLGKIRREENILWSFAPHDISMILSLAGESPESVSAIGGNYLHREIADVTMSHLNFTSGVKAHVFVSWLHPFKEQKLVVVGDKQMAEFDDTRPWDEKLLLYPHTIKWENQIPVPDKGEAMRVSVPQDEPLKLECMQFIKSVADGAEPYTNGEEGLRVLRVLNACQRSLDQGGREITLGGFGEPQDYFAHETAVVDPGARIGRGTKVWHFSHIMPGAVIGERCNIGQNVLVSDGVTVGDGCKIQNNVALYKGVSLEDEVFCGPSMVFTNVYNPRSHIGRMDALRETPVGRRATLGANCTIVCGNAIGAYSFVGAGAVVTKNVPPHALVVGNPAHQVGWVCRCGVTLDAKLACPECGESYAVNAGGELESA